jgi:hypothetical protein
VRVTPTVTSAVMREVVLVQAVEPMRSATNEAHGLNIIGHVDSPNRLLRRSHYQNNRRDAMATPSVTTSKKT